MNKIWNFNKVVNILIFGLVAGILIAGCGGGGGSTATGKDVFSYIADQQSGSFVGRWGYRGLSVEKADVNTLVASGTNQYTVTTAHKVLTSGPWGSDPSPDVYYDLISTGWLTGPDTVTLVDSGDGTNITITPTGEPGLGAAVTRTDLANTAIVCGSSPCTVPGNYPAGSASYQLTLNNASNQFELLGNGFSTPVTGTNGLALTALPIVNTTTFCDASNYFVFQPQGSAGIYNVFATANCTSGAITTATGGSASGTVTIDNLPTGIAGPNEASNVLHIHSATGAYNVVRMNNMIYGLRAGNVWYGWMHPPGNIQSSLMMNKTAMNAQLSASGLATFP